MLHLRALLALCLVGVSMASNGYSMHYTDVSAGGVCLDGTPGAYCMHTGADSNKWFIHLQGGGWCIDRHHCIDRARTPLGSSKSWTSDNCVADDGGANGMLSLDCDINPFCEWNLVYVRYCDGASFTGDRALPLRFDDQILYFRGAQLLRSTIDELLARGLANATDIVLAGCSAGGVAVYQHADWFRDLMSIKAPNALVVAAPDAGFFLDHADMHGGPGYTANFAAVVTLHNVSFTNARCVAHYAPIGEQWRCFMSQYMLPFIQTPLFITNDLADSWQFTNILQLDCNPRLADDCNAAQREAIVEYRRAMLTALAPQLHRSGGGSFLPSCNQHCEQDNDHTLTSELVGGVSMRHAFLAWLSAQQNGSAGPAVAYIDAPFGSNPTCTRTNADTNAFLYFLIYLFVIVACMLAFWFRNICSSMVSYADKRG
jgi:hypothetical protein